MFLEFIKAIWMNVLRIESITPEITLNAQIKFFTEISEFFLVRIEFYEVI